MLYCSQKQKPYSHAVFQCTAFVQGTASINSGEVMMSQKYIFSEVMGFVQLFWATYTRKVLYCTKQLRYGLLKFKLLHTNPSYLAMGHFIRNHSKIRKFSMGLNGTLNGLIFTFSRRASALELIWHTLLQLLSTLYDVVFKFAKLWHHTSPLHGNITGSTSPSCSTSVLVASRDVGVPCSPVNPKRSTPVNCLPFYASDVKRPNSVSLCLQQKHIGD